MNDLENTRFKYKYEWSEFMYKKLIFIFSIVCVFLSISINVNALTFSDVPQTASYIEELNRMTALQIISGDTSGLFRPNSYITRDQFAKIIVDSLGYKELASSMKGETPFEDVDASRWSSGYINVAVQKGIIKGTSDSTFSPNDDITFGQGCTLFVKALGYGDLEGTWPDNYISKASELKLSEEVSLDKNDKMARWQAVSMLDRFWIKNYEKNKDIVPKSLLENVSVEVNIVDTNESSDTLEEGQILTDKGMLKLKDDAKLELAGLYKVVIYDSDIIKVLDKKNITEKLTIDEFSGTKITYSKDNKNLSMILPEKTNYFYHGIKQSYANLEKILREKTDIIFGYNEEKTEYINAIIIDPMSSTSGDYSEIVVLGNSISNDTLLKNEVITDKGTFIVDDNIKDIELGNKYGVIIENGKIKQISEPKHNTKSYTIESVMGEKVYYKTSSQTSSFDLKDKINYYYNGVKQAFSAVPGLLKTNSIIIFSKGKNDINYVNAIICDPKYGKPEVVKTWNISNKKIGDIEFLDNKLIVKENKVIKKDELKIKDVLYNVVDINGKYSYILAIEDQLEGNIKQIIPNKLSPKSLKINETTLILNKYFDLNKLNYSSGSFNEDNHIIGLKGYDGTLVDIFDDTSNYAFVINYTREKATNDDEFGNDIYKVKLLMQEGNIAIYDSYQNPENLKGLIAKFNFDAKGKITLEKVDYGTYSEMIVDKSEKKLGNNYVTNNIKIFNIISQSSSVDTVVNLVDFEDLPNGKIPSNKIKYIHQSGVFEDIDFIVLNDILNDSFKLSYLFENIGANRSGTDSVYSYNMMVEGKSYVSKLYDVKKNDEVYKVYMNNNLIRSVYEKLDPVESSTTINAIDATRIKINNIVYKFKNNVAIYLRYKDKDNNNKVSVVESTNVDVSKTYNNVRVYLDKKQDEGGKVEVIVINVD